MEDRMTTRSEAREVRAATARWLVLWGKGAPDGRALEGSIGAVREVAEALADARRRGGHPLRLPAPEVRFEGAPRGARGGPSWTVLVRVPATVAEREVRA